MPFSTTGRNTMLDAVGITHCSLHTGYPGDAGANELSGGSYARQAITFAAAAAGARDSSNQPQFSVPGGSTVSYLGFWTALSAGTFLGYSALGGSPIRIQSVDTATETITAPAHGLSVGNRVAFIGGTPPAGLVEGTVYWVIASTADTFQVSATEGGAAVNLTGQNAGSRATRVIPETFGGNGTYTVSDADLSLNGF